MALRINLPEGSNYIIVGSVLICWGRVTKIQPANGHFNDYTVSLPKAYNSSDSYSTFVTGYYANYANVHYSAVNQNGSSFKVFFRQSDGDYFKATTGEIFFYWMTIGTI